MTHTHSTKLLAASSTSEATESAGPVDSRGLDDLVYHHAISDDDVGRESLSASAITRALPGQPVALPVQVGHCQCRLYLPP